MRSTKRIGLAALLAAALPVAGCDVGPDFQHPDLAKDASYLPEGADSAGGGGQTIKYGADVPARWWELFRNTQLDALMQQAIANSPTLAAAEAALKQANEQALSQRGSLFPSLSLSGSAERTDSRGSGTGSGSGGLYNVFNVTAALSYTVDIFGGTRRSIEAAKATAENQAFQAENAYLSLTAGLATAVVEEASYREQIEAEQEIISTLKEMLGVLNTQIAVGTASRANLLQQEASLAQAEASLPGLQKKLAQQENTIAVLAGQFPGVYRPNPYRLADFALPAELPVSLPAALVWQRPDVRSAEASLHYYTAEVGVAEAARLPSFTLSASLPTSAQEIGSLFASSYSGWALASSVAQPIFQGGKLLHNERAAEAAYEGAYATYRSSVLTAFKDVANALRAVEHDRVALQSYLTAERAARDSLDLARSRFTAGTGAYTDVLSAQQTYQSARIARASAEADRYLDAITLFEALGGGWWNRPDNLAGKANTDPAEPPAAPVSGEKK